VTLLQQRTTPAFAYSSAPLSESPPAIGDRGASDRSTIRHHSEPGVPAVSAGSARGWREAIQPSVRGEPAIEGRGAGLQGAGCHQTAPRRHGSGEQGATCRRDGSPHSGTGEPAVAGSPITSKGQGRHHPVKGCHSSERDPPPARAKPTTFGIFVFGGSRTIYNVGVRSCFEWWIPLH
jgi:hypothetical protein